MFSLAVNDSENDEASKAYDQAVEKLAQEIADRIRSRRSELAGVTDETLGKATGRSRRGMQAIMKGDSTKQYAKLYFLAKALQTTPDYLLGFSSKIDEAVLQSAFLTLMEEARSLPDLQTRPRVLLEALAATAAENVLAVLRRPGEGSHSTGDLDRFRSQIRNVVAALFAPTKRQ